MSDSDLFLMVRVLSHCLSSFSQLLLSIPPTTQLTVFLDCSGGQTILDPAGSLTPFSFIKGNSAVRSHPRCKQGNQLAGSLFLRSEVQCKNFPSSLSFPEYFESVAFWSALCLQASSKEGCGQ